MSDLYLPWPYAAKGIIQHEFDIDHLNLWITFRFAMYQKTKPPNNLWLCTVDDVSKTISNSEWQDVWTLLLTVSEVTEHPNRVLLSYDGPHKDLKIVWHKQWEPWGPILSLDITT